MALKTLTCFPVFRHALAVPFNIHRDQGNGVQGVWLKAPQDCAGGGGCYLLLLNSPETFQSVLDLLF